MGQLVFLLKYYVMYFGPVAFVNQINLLNPESCYNLFLVFACALC